MIVQNQLLGLPQRESIYCAWLDNFSSHEPIWCGASVMYLEILDKSKETEMLSDLS